MESDEVDLQVLAQPNSPFPKLFDLVNFGKSLEEDNSGLSRSDLQDFWARNGVKKIEATERLAQAIAKDGFTVLTEDSEIRLIREIARFHHMMEFVYSPEKRAALSKYISEFHDKAKEVFKEVHLWLRDKIKADSWYTTDRFQKRVNLFADSINYEEARLRRTCVVDPVDPSIDMSREDRIEDRKSCVELLESMASNFSALYDATKHRFDHRTDLPPQKDWIVASANLIVKAIQTAKEDLEDKLRKDGYSPSGRTHASTAPASVRRATSSLHSDCDRPLNAPCALSTVSAESVERATQDVATLLRMFDEKGVTLPQEDEDGWFVADYANSLFIESAVQHWGEYVGTGLKDKYLPTSFLDSGDQCTSTDCRAPSSTG